MLIPGAHDETGSEHDCAYAWLWEVRKPIGRYLNQTLWGRGELERSLGLGITLQDRQHLSFERAKDPVVPLMKDGEQRGFRYRWIGREEVSRVYLLVIVFRCGYLKVLALRYRIALGRLKNDIPWNDSANAPLVVTQQV